MAKAASLAANADLRASAEAFLKAAASATLSESELLEAFTRTPGFHFSMGVYFSLRPEVLRAQHELVQPALRRLGAQRGKDELRSLTWRHAAAWVTAAPPCSLAAAARGLLIEMDESGLEVTLFLPNYTFQLAPGCEGVRLGKVEVLPASAAVAAAEPYGETMRVSLDGERGLDRKEGLMVAHFPQVCWRVRLRAAAKNAREEGAWLIDVAISLARLLHRPWAGLPPDLKDVEPHAFEPTHHAQPGFAIYGDNYGLGPMSRPRYYLIDDAAVAGLMSAQSQMVADAILDPLAERVSQKLGWMTRARRVTDKSEAFLHFFTALEALFSAERGQPVTQTIARHFAVIWSDEPEARRIAAKWLADLYNVRSSVVHAGKREALAADVRSLHHAVDRVFRAVLLQVDLRMPAQTFSEYLRNASYGSPWPFRNASVK